MDNFDLKKYLAEGRLLKEEVMVNPIIMFGGKDYIEGIIAEPDDYGHFPEDAEWIKSNILTAPKMVSIQDYMDLDDKWVKQAQIETGQGSDLDHIVDALNVHVKQGLITPEQAKEAMKVVGLAEGKLLKENNLDSLIDKYGQKMIDFTIGVDQLTSDEVNDIEYLEDRIKTHLEEPAIRQKYLAEGKLLKEDEEQGYTLYTTNVEYDNGKTGYMYQLVNSEDGEENEIGFDQLYFVGKGDASDPQVFLGKDFKDFDQGSYQEEEVSAEEAMKIYNELK